MRFEKHFGKPIWWDKLATDNQVEIQQILLKLGYMPDLKEAICEAANVDEKKSEEFLLWWFSGRHVNICN